MSENENLNEDLNQDNLALKVTYEGDEDRDIKEEMENCYIDYAMSVIVSRALPDVRDGFKPVHRRILYTMEENNLRPSAKFRKSAKVVWDVLWKYHPHWDSAVYQAMVRMAQDFSLRYPLVNGQWNFGSIDWDNAAAQRYTEAKMEKISEFMLSDIKKDTVDFRDNYDWTEREPSVLPSRVPNLLMNWVMWIAVWMATNIPPHNLWELLDAMNHLIDNEPRIDDITTQELMEFVKGPDFPTGWEVYDKDALLKAYSTWRWSVIMRWKAEFEDLKSGKKAIVINEIPYQIVKSTLVEKIAELVKEKKIVWISDLRDESNKDSIRIVVELKKDAFPKKILNQLFKLTNLQTSFGYNMVALWDRWMQPRLFNLKDILVDFINHRVEVVERRTSYELWVAKARAHILEGLKIALDNIDEIIKIIKSSKDKDTARVNLMSTFWLTEIQSNAILDMQLSKLSWLERQKIEDELAEKLLLIADLEDILARRERVIAIIKEETKEIREKFLDERRTVVNSWKVWEFNPKDTIPNEDIFVVLTKNSYIKRLQSSAFRTQRRWGKWITTATKEDDEIKLTLSTKNHNDLLFFTTKWRVFSLPAYEIPETTRTAKWQAIINLLSLQKDEEISAVLDITAEKNEYLLFVTKAWIVKKLEMEQVKNIRSSGLIVLKIKEWDELSWVKTTSWADHIFIATRQWKAIQFKEWDVRPMWRAASWVRWIKLKEDDSVVEVTIVSENDEFVLVVSEKWMWKITAIWEYRDQNRWWAWVKAMAMTAKTGKLISAMTLSKDKKDESDILLISKEWQTIRMSLKWIRTTSRVTQWVILTKLKDENDCIVSASLVIKSDEEEES